MAAKRPEGASDCPFCCAPADDGVVNPEGASVVSGYCDGGVLPRGGLSARLPPQHAMVLSVLMAQEWLVPTAMEGYWPEGASACPLWLYPQQATVLSAPMAHEVQVPAAMRCTGRRARWLARGRCSPAGDGLVGLDGAGMGGAGCDGGVLGGGRFALLQLFSQQVMVCRCRWRRNVWRRL